jgi:hypothetical protein
MQLFDCKNCQQTIYFENTHCISCSCLLGFDPERMQMVALESQPGGELLAVHNQQPFRYCDNHRYDACNWLIAADNPHQFCIACQLNDTIPDLSRPEFLERWKVIEQAKHRLIYALIKWGLPLSSKIEDPQNGLSFKFKANEDMPQGQKVLTGHANGVITLNIAEADDVEREMARNQMDEVYRTVLGHFRHEIGHYYWDILISRSQHLKAFRQLYGDERADYQAALERHYDLGPPENWRENYISAYATMHPWESWAETWAHYMHMVDTLETAYAHGLKIDPKVGSNHSSHLVEVNENAYSCPDFEKIFQNWFAVSLMMNSLNRSMGSKDVYPFVINARVKEKLAFIHGIIHQQKKDKQQSPILTKK